jgi:hypothetical protein
MCGVACAGCTVEIGFIMGVCTLVDEQAALANIRSKQSSVI